VIKRLKQKIEAYGKTWFNKRNPKGNPQCLTSHNVYILPAPFGVVYGIVLITLFTGAINYQISAVFLMTFLLGVIGLVSAWQTHANLKDISIQLISIKDAELGSPALVTLLIKPNQKVRFNLEIYITKHDKVHLATIPIDEQQIILPIRTDKRGYFPLPRITLASSYPFGLFCAWGYVYYDQHYHVYPQSLSPGFWPEPTSLMNPGQHDKQGHEDFYDLKAVNTPWAQPNRIAWKIAAKNQGWYLKMMESSDGDFWVFKLSDLPAQDIEINLQHLSYWLQEAEVSGDLYALELNQILIPINHGEYHLRQCLQQLAKFP
jgi:uncharacterized protein (DUF58 family)